MTNAHIAQVPVSIREYALEETVISYCCIFLIDY